MDEGDKPAGIGRSLHLAAEFWERRRLAYNALLAITFVVWLILGWHDMPRPLTLGDVGALAVLVLLANVCYSLAYIPDVIMQTVLKPVACDRARRWLWLAGMLVALIAESYWINDEILLTPRLTLSTPSAMLCPPFRHKEQPDGQRRRVHCILSPRRSQSYGVL